MASDRRRARRLRLPVFPWHQDCQFIFGGGQDVGHGQDTHVQGKYTKVLRCIHPGEHRIYSQCNKLGNGGS